MDNLVELERQRAANRKRQRRLSRERRREEMSDTQMIIIKYS
jgi:hypothetical protein